MKGFTFQKNSLIPWIITLGMGVYVFGLTQHAKNRPSIHPMYDFYDTAIVHLHIREAQELHDVYGMYNNIIEGQKQIVKAVAGMRGDYKLVFKVNSPRPATVFVDDQAIEVFLVPGDTSLSLNMTIRPVSLQIEELHFNGKTANICRYMLAKRERMGDFHIRSKRNALDSDDFAQFSHSLDSMAQGELSFLNEQNLETSLPEWFSDFEVSEIQYQKAYLKLSNAYNREIPDSYLDQIESSNPAAVFSYYYYLYLKTYISTLDTAEVPVDLLRPELRYQHLTEKQLAIADTLLKGEMHDVYLTRVIFSHLKRNETAFAEKLFNAYEDRFNRKKYQRFLNAQIRDRGEAR